MRDIDPYYTWGDWLAFDVFTVGVGVADNKSDESMKIVEQQQYKRHHSQLL